MQDRNQALLALSGRLLIAALFLPAGLGKIANFAGITGMIASKGLPAPAALAALVIALELGASLALLAGFRIQWAALALAVFTVAAGLLFHDFWAAPAAQAMAQQQAFFKNLGIAGGLLLLAALGPGPLTLDSRKKGS
ncbi:DoxX family protein [Ramlibacter sp. XY19]|uniref:DoxX family protein n=1 Tax=Ramlibacter paludis TaxID=2908000 RepID=UPI0023DA3AEE|nr:DoxX family protein [Ramlibacter paludis]MCG2592393.1 DoxX family protein [Ramlibacter paludis]